MNKVKALFPDNVEKIIISKDDYDRLTGELTLENIELKQEIERLNAELELYKDNQIHLINQLEQKDNSIKEVRELLNQEWYSVLRKGTITKVKEILDKVEENK